MLVIDNKKYRNMQEQVAYNAEEIERINKYLDGIDLKDKLIIIDSTSGELSDDDMLIAQSPLAFISNGSTVYIKASEDQDEILFRACDIVATEVSNAYFNVGGSKIVVTKLTKEFALSSDAIITTYSKSQIDSILSGYAPLSGANFIGPVTSPSIIENMNGYSFTSSSAIENIVKEDVFAGVVKNGNKLTIVCACNLTKTAATSGRQEFGIFYVPQTVLDKLIPTQIGEYNYLDIRIIQGASTGWSTINMNVYAQKTSAIGGGVRLAIDSAGLSNMQINTKYYVRYELTFLLNDSLV